MPSSSFCTYFVHVLRCSKRVFQTEILPKKVLKFSYFYKKTPKFLNAKIFLGPPSGVTNFNTSPMPPFEVFSLDALNSKQKPSVKRRSTGVDFEIYRSYRVEKILIGFISEWNLLDYHSTSIQGSTFLTLKNLAPTPVCTFSMTFCSS